MFQTKKDSNFKVKKYTSVKYRAAHLEDNRGAQVEHHLLTPPLLFLSPAIKEKMRAHLQTHILKYNWSRLGSNGFYG